MIMNPQPPVDNTQLRNILASAEFDPPVVRPGEKFFYRVTINATQNSIEWPDKFSVPAGLRLGLVTRGQLSQPDGTPFRPLTEFLCEITATASGHFTIPNFSVSVGGRAVEIPAASIDVQANAATEPPRKLSLEVSATNLFFGQPFRVRVISPAAQGNHIEALRDVQFNGGGFLTDKLATHQSIEVINYDGQLKPAFIYETVATPMAAGAMKLSAQGFTVPPFSAGPITITAGGGPVTLGGSAQTSPVFLVSDAVQLKVRPLPMPSELPGFTGAMGKFFSDPPQLATNRVRVGEPVHLKLNFHGEGSLTRFVPPAPPRSREWQIIADSPPDNGFTLIPQTDDVRATPAIPFCSFDATTGQYLDLTIPPMPITILNEGLPVKLAVFDDNEKSSAPLELSGLVPTPGKSVASLRPPQLCGWFLALQFLPVVCLIALWRWDEWRRFLEAHPEIVRRRKARHALRREKIKLQTVWDAGDSNGFVRHAAEAMRIAVAPHFPAQPRALVCADVLAQITETERGGTAGETVQKIFAAADAQFSLARQAPADLPASKAEVDAVLLKLEERL